ncbi:MAG: hypothetical protein KatS3mg068_1138 [Candidatus Sericytochromatia bacterium]|nr:MAG: hypothetical protein KatS3mg068_1138 [Candidatus Sericytochromatia bacterium]
MNRFFIQKILLEKGIFFKLVCGAGNEDPEEVKRLSFIYTLAGAKGIDISANPEIVISCKKGIKEALKYSNQNILEPFITISIGMKGDPHVRKAIINNKKCIKCNLCIPVCPTDAIPSELIIKENKCIGCGNCSAICPVNVIDYYHNYKDLEKILPVCLEYGAENIELHASIYEDEIVLKEWEFITKINPNNYNSICLDRNHLSDFKLENRIKKIKEISKDKLIVQADGIPMSGSINDFNTTLQTIAIADIINKKFNKKIDKKTKKYVYKKNIEVNILLSGGTNMLTSKLAKQNNVKYQGISVGTYARNLVKDFINKKDFWTNKNLINNAVNKAKKLVNSI